MRVRVKEAFPMMKRAVISGLRQAGVVEAPVPEPKENWVLVKVHVAPMCTEYKSFLEGKPGAYLGHEAAGEVVATAQPGRARVGERVVVQPLHSCGRCSLCISGDFIHCQQAPSFVEFTGSWRSISSSRTGCSPPSRTASPTNARRWPVVPWGLPSVPTSG
jgi:threonine dehydrogenase-like Zn-dependent dehydrogenase